MTRHQAARTNGALSHGPTTEQGKARSSQNAIKHGLNARSVVLAHESQEAFDRLLADYQSRYLPVGEVEHDFVFSMTAARWRVQRIAIMEKAVFDQEIQRLINNEENPLDPDAAIAAAYANVAAGTALNRLHKYECRLRRDFTEAERQLLAVQEARLLSSDDCGVQNEPDAPNPSDKIRAGHHIAAPEFPRAMLIGQAHQGRTAEATTTYRERTVATISATS